MNSRIMKATSATTEATATNGDPGGGEPIFFLAFVEDDLQAGRSDGEHADAPVIDFCRCALDVGRIEDEHARHDDGGEADGHIDVENPAPTVAVGEPAAEHGAEQRRDDDAESPEAHGFAAILWRKDFEQDGLRDRLEAAAARALNDAADDQQAEAWERVRSEGSDREAGDGQHQHALAAEIIREPAGDGKDDGVGDEVGSERPGGFVDGGGKAAGDVRERDVDDGGVEHFHEGGEHHRDGDEPRIDAAGTLV